MTEYAPTRHQPMIILVILRIVLLIRPMSFLSTLVRNTQNKKFPDQPFTVVTAFDKVSTLHSYTDYNSIGNASKIKCKGNTSITYT